MSPHESDIPEPLQYPELVIGFAGPIGVDLDFLTLEAQRQLAEVNYTSDIIRLTSVMAKIPLDDVQPVLKGHLEEYSWKIEYANKLRSKFRDAGLFARIAIAEIQLLRKSVTGDRDKPQQRHAYLIRQLKLPDEVSLLRKVYGKQFLLISGYAPEAARLAKLEAQIRLRASTMASEAEIRCQALHLAERDQGEDFDYGQQLRETFHQADFFMEGINKSNVKVQMSRFIGALFGRNDISPSRDEYGMFAAKSASLRSLDLSRQVGAAIFTSHGEIISQGCNEVPKAGGGTYWGEDTPDNRDFHKGHDPNDRIKKEILRDIVERLRKLDYLSAELVARGTDDEIVDFLLGRNGALRKAAVSDLTEFGRIVHAEMSAVCDAARLGKSIRGATLYCTTFPCHNCTKHLIASGIHRVVFMEPYPKSRARALHEDELQIESEDDPQKVSFVPFLGVAPSRYRDLFEKKRRKGSDGSAQLWYRDDKRPMLEVVFPSYITNEIWAVAPLIPKETPTDASPPLE